MVFPRSTVKGSITASASMTTSGSIQVVSGSVTATPAAICSSTIRRRSAAAASANSARVFTPRPMIEVLQASGAPRKVLTHIHHSNPILDRGGAQHRELAEQGIEVAHDGMVIEL